MPKRKPKLPATEEVLAAMGQHALKGKQGRVAAGRAYLDHVAGRPISKQPEATLNISESTLKRVCDIAAKLAAKCAYCGKPVGGSSTFVPEPNAESGTFQAYEPQPEPAKAATEEPGVEKAVLHRQPRTVTNPDPQADHRGSFPKL